jgi:hypothetical protein
VSNKNVIYNIIYTIFPTLIPFGEGIIKFLIKEKRKKRELKLSLMAQSYIRNHQIGSNVSPHTIANKRNPAKQNGASALT